MSPTPPALKKFNIGYIVISGFLYRQSGVFWSGRCNYDSSGVVLHVGGNYNHNQNYGLFYLNGNNSASNSNGNIGSRILVYGLHNLLVITPTSGVFA